MAQRPVIEGARRTCPFRHFEHGEHRARFDHHAWRRTANEIDSAVAGDDADSGNGDDGALDTGKIINRGIARGVGRGAKTPGSSRAKSNSEIVRSFDGLNFFDQRFANNGNQFSVEPPDQGLCVGNGFVMESVNNAIKIYDTAGNLLVGPIDDNTFYGYPAAINRSTTSADMISAV